jgi:outer membrane lipopolysaccharide assembly protein LptE/RlpB
VSKLAPWLAVFLWLGITGCGYHPAGKAVLLPTDVRTIAIPGFVNQTKTYRVEQVLNAAVVHEFTTRTHYHVLNQASADTDAILHGTVTNAVLTPLTYDSQTGRVASGMIMLTMNVSLVDRHGKVLFSNSNYIFRDQYEISSQISSFFEEESPALDRMSKDFARTLVSNILEAF